MNTATATNCHKDCAPVGHVRECPNAIPGKEVMRSFEESREAVEALGTLSKLGLIEWRKATPEEDSLEIDLIGTITMSAHDGWCMSPYIIINGVFLAVSKGMVRQAWNLKGYNHDFTGRIRALCSELANRPVGTYDDPDEAEPLKRLKGLLDVHSR